MAEKEYGGIWRCFSLIWVGLVFGGGALVTSAPAGNDLANAIFQDVAAASGIDFVHFNGMSGEFYFCEVMGSGVALFDYDNDGDLDIYLVQGGILGPGKTLAHPTMKPPGSSPLKDRLYRNDLTVAADGKRILKFTDVTEASGIVSLGYGMGVATGDFDNNGYMDLHVTNFAAADQTFRNNGDGTFTDVTEKTGTGDERFTTSAAFLDFDRDGWLDLFVCADLNFSYATHTKCYSRSGELDYCGPKVYQPIHDRLYRNRGDGTFEDVSVKSQIVREYGSGLGVVCDDFNGDGWVDIYVANDARPNQLWINRKDGTFFNDALMAGCAVDRNGNPEGSMGVDSGDFDGDGDPDLFMTHLSTETNTVYVNDGTGMFEDRSLETGLGMPSMPFTAFGVGWFDYDNDGWLDILAVNGEVRTIEMLARNNDPYPLHQTNQLFHNLGHGRFEEVSESAGPSFALSEVSRGAAFGDVDNDGDVDVLVTNNNGPVRLLINRLGNRNHWIGLRMVGGDKLRDMIGARVAVYRSNGPVLWRHVHTAASYCSANDPRLLVGLGESSKITKIVAFWPDGKTEQWTDVPIDTYTTLSQGSGEEVENR